MRGIIVAGTLTALLAGCAPAPHLPEQLPPAVDPVAWAGRLCAALSPLSGLRNIRPNFDPNDPATSKTSLGAYFNDTQSRLAESLRGMDQVGPSPIAGGDDVARKLRGGLEKLGTAFADARTRVEAVDPTDPVELGAKLPDILNGLAAAANDPDLTNLGDNEALNGAVRQSPSCGMVKGDPAKATG